ncbi:peptidoglycan-binding protein [Conexibacter sp. JD483]|uniref:peptidoglycan-binding domain-containing protein n=1 Tax=unclassified Conexibacter TaxID=2627773 RepID=UPI002716C078|nr:MULTISPECIES: peptidoglycan-binding protein [unclassified Conexibacter]MDO8186844.1 peptidoglycan-binding protein [Conexibacter sp. CPCC 205706]MDO8197402.1 peptidoglycan-binding protein [Conexibacter sp. CPCC 205762]MDR9372703.1 peptidoglycan-binding protein [Conexibacter sp. JD483]
MNQEQRDLALDDLWAKSLERSLARRGARPRTSAALARLKPRDLSDPEHFLDSLSVAQRRREAAASQSKLPAPAARGLSLTALLAVTAGPAVGTTVALTGTASAATVVERGDRGRDVKKLQNALGVHADGIFGPGTKKALRKFQARHHLHVDGVAGAATWSALKRSQANTASASSKKVVAGGKAKIIGHSVRAVQRELGVAADGVFGPQSLKALKSFQREHGLAADGVVGPATWRAMARDSDHGKGASSGRRTTARAAVKTEGSGVEALQRALGIGADGDFGPATEKALKRWQASKGLEADGIAGPATRSALGLGDGPVLKRGGKEGGGNDRGGSWADQKIAAMVAAGNRIQSTPYIYGGGHGSFEDSGYDCSGSVSYVLHGAGLLDSPLASGGFTSWGEPGPGKRVTIYANAGHAYMVIDGRRFDTSGASAAGTRWQADDRSSAGYVAVHPAGL